MTPTPTALGLAMLLAASTEAQGDPATSPIAHAPRLYPGEEIVQAAGYPALARFEPGPPGSRLAVFVTGGGVLARIAYGPPEGRPADFLSHWLQREGFSVLAVSYPMANPAMEGAFPQFSVRDWGAQTAALVDRTVTAHGLPRSVVILGWSMAGRVAEPLATALRSRTIDPELFVAMAATPPLPGLLPGLSELRPAATGLARIEGGYLDWLLSLLADQNRRAGRVVISPERFVADFTGDFPIRLAASAMRYEAGRFVPDPAGDAEDTGASRYEAFPPLAVMTHASPIDPHHALVDRAAWGFYIAQTLAARHLFAHVKDFSALEPTEWQRLLSVVHGAPERLTGVLPGNHLFFVGEEGARATASALKELLPRAQAISAELHLRRAAGR